MTFGLLLIISIIHNAIILLNIHNLVYVWVSLSTLEADFKPNCEAVGGNSLECHGLILPPLTTLLLSLTFKRVHLSAISGH